VSVHQNSSSYRIVSIPNVVCSRQGITPLHWSSEFRYLRVFIVSSRSFKCSLAYAKRSFYAAANGLFGKLLDLASKEVILELVRRKRTPMLLYWLECFQLGKLHSLDFTFNRLCMKLFLNWEYWCSKRLSEPLSCWSAEPCPSKKAGWVYVSIGLYFYSEWFMPILQHVVILN